MKSSEFRRDKFPNQIFVRKVQTTSISAYFLRLNRKAKITASGAKPDAVIFFGALRKPARVRVSCLHILTAKQQCLYFTSARPADYRAYLPSPHSLNPYPSASKPNAVHVQLPP